MYTWEIADAVKNEYITVDEVRTMMDNSPQVNRWTLDGIDENYSYHTLITDKDGTISFRMRNYDKR